MDVQVNVSVGTKDAKLERVVFIAILVMPSSNVC